MDIALLAQTMPPFWMPMTAVAASMGFIHAIRRRWALPQGTPRQSRLLRQTLCWLRQVGIDYRPATR